MAFVSTLSAAAVAVLLAWAVATDIGARLIPNAVPAGIALLWALSALAGPGGAGAAAGGFLAGLATFAAGLPVYRLGLLGGGDVKLLSALALWAGPGDLAALVLVTAVAGGALALAWIALDKVGPWLPAAIDRIVQHGGGPAARGRRPSLPYGVAIAAAGLWLIHPTIWP
jgi:prepilin peptidase CpaA